MIMLGIISVSLSFDVELETSTRGKGKGMAVDVRIVIWVKSLMNREKMQGRERLTCTTEVQF